MVPKPAGRPRCTLHRPFPSLLGLQVSTPCPRMSTWGFSARPEEWQMLRLRGAQLEAGNEL